MGRCVAWSGLAPRFCPFDSGVEGARTRGGKNPWRGSAAPLPARRRTRCPPCCGRRDPCRRIDATHRSLLPAIRREFGTQSSPIDWLRILYRVPTMLKMVSIRGGKHCGHPAAFMSHSGCVRCPVFLFLQLFRARHADAEWGRHHRLSLPSSIACDAGRHSFRSSSRREQSRPVHLHGHCRCSRQ